MVVSEGSDSKKAYMSRYVWVSPNPISSSLRANDSRCARFWGPRLEGTLAVRLQKTPRSSHFLGRSSIESRCCWMMTSRPPILDSDTDRRRSPTGLI